MSDRWRAAFRKLAGIADVDPRAFYAGRVLRGYADGHADIDPELEVFPPLTRIPIRPFAPGVVVNPPRGVLCFFGFEQGDIGRPFVAFFVGGSSGLKVARDTDPVDLKLFVSPDLVPKVAIGAPLAAAVVPVTGRGAIDGGSSIVRIG